MGPAHDIADPTILNSNLFPVKAKGDVLFLSELSLGKEGSASTPTSVNATPFETYFSPLPSFSNISPSMSPRNTEIMAGGGLLGPGLGACPAVLRGAGRSAAG